MQDWIPWIITTIVTLVIGLVGFFLKRLVSQNDAAAKEHKRRMDEIEKRLQSQVEAVREKSDSRMDEIETRLQSQMETVKEKSDGRINDLEKELSTFIQNMPLYYTLRDDFIRSMSSVNNKLDKLLERIGGNGSGQ